jgi:hypothetical protein
MAIPATCSGALQRHPKRHLTAIGIAEDVDMFFINLTLRDFAGDQTLDEGAVVGPGNFE